MVKAKYIKTMDFTFENVNILNCNNFQEVANKIKENEVLIIENDKQIEYINSAYVMFYNLYD